MGNMSDARAVGTFSKLFNVWLHVAHYALYGQIFWDHGSSDNYFDQMGILKTTNMTDGGRGS